MGVPALFRWLTSKSKAVLTYATNGRQDICSTPDKGDTAYDNFYLDMNGIIHGCAHPEGGIAPESEEEMIEAIFAVIDRLFAIVQPQRLIYLSVDGVAPRAKMNQQRQRRFAAAYASGQQSTEWDTNAITPGTPFMEKVSAGLRCFIAQRVATSPAWKRIKVIFSDASVPGEGEHKIIDFIRRQRNAPGYDPSTRHCIYGLDADLIILGLVTHEEYVDILRDAPSNSKKRQSQHQTLLEKKMVFLHCSEVRKLIVEMMGPFSFDADVDRLIDDFVLLSFLIGNDFLPHSPALSIKEGGIEILVDAYNKRRSSFDDYITNAGTVNTEKLIEVLRSVIIDEDMIMNMRRKTGAGGEGYCNSEAAPLKDNVIEGILAVTERFLGADCQNKSSKGESKINIPNAFVGEPRSLSPNFQQWDEGIKRLSHLSPTNGTTNETKIETRATRERLFQESDWNEKATQKAIQALFKRASELRLEPKEKCVEKNAHKVHSQDKELLSPNSEKRKCPESIEELFQRASTLRAKQEHEKIDDLTLQNKRPRATLEPLSSCNINMPDQLNYLKRLWHKKYYINRFGITNPNDKIVSLLCNKYVEGLNWVMQYYYQGCPDWDWFFPFYYAPFICDIVVNVSPRATFSFTQHCPCSPLEQLLYVLPPSSAHLLPKSLPPLQTELLAIDANGAHASWKYLCLLSWQSDDEIKRKIHLASL